MFMYGFLFDDFYVFSKFLVDSLLTKLIIIINLENNNQL